MSEMEPRPGNQDEIIINRNYLTSDNVRARFELYNFAQPTVDIEATAIEALHLKGDETIIDIGAADGSLLQRLRIEFGHQGRLIGVEPNFSQVETTPLWKPMEHEIVLKGLSRLSDTLLPTHSPGFLDELVDSLTRAPERDLELYEGDANNIPQPDATADVLLAMFMLYHVPEHKQPSAFAEFKRVLKDDGIFVMATSGADNKKGHRYIEEAIAEVLKVRKPMLMNNGFDTEKAMHVVPQHFKHVYVFFNHSRMVIDEPYRINRYLNSLRSLRDQFDPSPSVEDFEAVLQMVVTPVLIKAVRQFGAFTDEIRRSVIIASDKELRLNPELFEDISSAA